MMRKSYELICTKCLSDFTKFNNSGSFQDSLLLQNTNNNARIAVSMHLNIA